LEQAAEKIEFSATAPEGAVDNTAPPVCLKAYPDTNHEFFRRLLEAAPLQNLKNTMVTMAVTFARTLPPTSAKI
jgi:hypothetical protein